MSKYTMQLRYLCELKAGLLESSDDYNAVINASYKKIIHPETGLYDPSYEPVLYKKILRHYYFDEIGHETAAQFIMRLNTKLDEILPYYNKMYASAALEFNPFYDVDYTLEGNREDNNIDNRTRTDNLQSQRTDNLTNTRTDDLQSQRTDLLQSQRTDNLTNIRTDDLTNLRTDALQSQRTDNLQNQRTDNLQNLRTDNLTSQRTDNLANSASSTSYKLFSDTPEGALSGVDNESYLTNAEKTISSANGTNTGTQTTVDTGTQTNAATGTQTTAATGTQTTADTGTQTNKATGTQTNAATGTQTTADTGTQTIADTGTQTNKATGTQIVDNTGTQTNNAVVHNLNEYFEHVTGKRSGASYASLLMEFRETFLNIDMMIIKELKNLFMGVY